MAKKKRAVKAAKKEECCHSHPHHCCKGFAVVLLVLGILFLLKDLQVWNFWGINWWTVLFLLFGIKMCIICCLKKK
jgi:hypothetical protein